MRQETLGRWHYLHRLDGMVYALTQSPPMVIAFGEGSSRIAVLLPGSNIVAEFKDGRFDNLHFPGAFTPCSLAADHQGHLCVLGQKLITSGYGDDDRFVIFFNGREWSAPNKIPFNLCDQLAFDREDRLWAVGPAPTVAVDRHGAWDTYAYSNDRKLNFAPIRLAADAAGDPVLFAYVEPWSLSHLVGTLTYHNGIFIRDPQADATVYVQAQKEKEPEDMCTPMDPPQGYVVEPCRGLRASTRLSRKGYTFVSLGTDGLAWTGPADEGTPLLSLAAEWEPVTHIQFDPVLDPQGNLWLMRNNPLELLEVTPHGRKEFPFGPGIKHPELLDSIDFDAKGRPWLTHYRQPSEEAAVFDQGQFVYYPDLTAAIRGEASKFGAGRILPFATKAPSGLIEYGGWHGDSEAIVMLDGAAESRFKPEDIDPAEPSERPTTGHGYNAFRNSDLWLDKSGSLHTRVLDQDFVYSDGKWTSSPLAQDKDSVIPPLSTETDGPVIADDGSNLIALGKYRIIYRGFHFYRDEGGREKQLDSGLNPLAQYPFWSGMEPALLDPQNRLWVAELPQNVHPHDATWWVERVPSE